MQLGEKTTDGEGIQAGDTIGSRRKGWPWKAAGQERQGGRGESGSGLWAGDAGGPAAEGTIPAWILDGINQQDSITFLQQPP